MRKLCGSIGAVTLVFLSLCGGANADIITFNGLAGPNQAPFVTYSEAGFTVAATGGSPEQGLLFGNPVPSVIIGAPLFSPVAGTVDTTVSGGGTFTFSSMDLASNNGVSSSFSAQGFLGASSVYNFTGTVPSTSVFVTENNPFSGAVIDRLRITVTPGAAVSSDNLDNIVVAPTAVPEPSTLTLILVSSVLVGLGGIAWRRQPRRN